MPRGNQAQLSDPQFLEAALEGLELQRQRLDQQIAQVRAMLGRGRPGRPPKNAAAASTESAAGKAAAPRKRRRLSPEARKRIAAAQKKRWANYRKTEKKNEAA